MKTLNWKRTDWTARNFIFSIGQEVIGQLTFNSTWNFKAVYVDKETKLKFTQKNFWDRDIIITQGGKTLGVIHSGLFGEQTLKLLTGERFFISTSMWEQEAYLKSEKGETIVSYKQATFSSLEKGLIGLKDSLTTETEKLLIISGLFARQIARKRIARAVLVIIPIIAASSRL